MLGSKHSNLPFVVFLLLLFYINPLAAQDEFVNQEIRVGKFQPVDIKFSEEIVSLFLAPQGMYEQELSGNRKTCTISASKDNLGLSCTLTLVVGLGKNPKKHTFKIVYREEIPDNEAIYDYTDSKVLKAAIKANQQNQKYNAAEVVKPQPAQEKPKEPVVAQKPAPVENKTPATTPAATTTTATVPDKKPPVSTSTTANTSAATDYATLVNQAYEAFDKADYAGAQALVQKALVLRPGDRQATKLKMDADAKLEEQKLAGEKTRKENYYKAIGSAEMAANTRDYDKAEFFYNQAKEFEDPGSSYVKTRLADLEIKKKTKEEDERRDRALKEKEDNYKKAKSLADIALAKGDYEYARQQYREALTYKEQDSYANSKLIEIDNRIAKEKKDQELAEKQSLYNGARSSADEYFKSENYELARTAYNEALKYNPGDPYATGRLKEIETNIARKRLTDAQKERERNYNEIIGIADAAFNTGDYDVALEKYAAAAKWMPSESYPSKKITEIKGLQKATAQRLEAEKTAAAKQKKLDDDFTAAVSRGDVLMNKQDFANAKTSYKQALALKPYEQYPKDKLSEMENILAGMAVAAKARKDSIDAITLLKTKYNDAIARGKKANAAKDYPGAKAAYTEALQLIDTASFPAAQIANIDRTLALIAAREQARLDSLERVRVFNEKYDSLVFAGAAAMTAENFDGAIAAYREAIDMKPDAVYPRNLLKYSIDRKAEKLAKDSLAKEEQQDAAYRTVRKDGMTAMKEKRYADARVLFGKALSLMIPGKDYGNDKEYLLNRMAAIDFALSQPVDNTQPVITQPVVVAETPKKEPDAEIKKPETPVSEPAAVTTAPAENKPEVKKEVVVENNPATSTATVPVAEKGALTHQTVALPYTREELFTRYPTINFAEPPPGQGFNVAEYYDTTENFRVSQMVLTETPRLNISETQEGITLICEGISFSGTNAFCRLRLQNKSKEAFPVGVMLLTWQKKDGNEIKLFPGYVSSFPLLLPGKEIGIIYVCKSSYVAESEALQFTMKDRMKKIKLTLRIPGDVYNKEFNR